MGNELKKSLEELDTMADALLKGDGGEQLSAGDISDNKSADDGKKDDKADGAAASDAGEGGSKEEDPKKVSKSLTESEFLNKKFEEINASVNLLKGVVEKSVTTQDDSMTIFAKSFSAIAQTQSLMADMMKSIGGQVTEINGRLNNLESQPQMRKSINSLNVFNKDFQKSAGLPAEQLSKSQIAAILSDELFKGNPNVTKQDVIGFESGAPLRNELMTLINNRANQ